MTKKMSGAKTNKGKLLSSIFDGRLRQRHMLGQNGNDNEKRNDRHVYRHIRWTQRRCKRFSTSIIIVNVDMETNDNDFDAFRFLELGTIVGEKCTC